MLELQLPDRVLHFQDRPLVMGIVNVTPDSFSDGGRFAATDAAIAHALELVRQEADLLDIGGESSRPGAEPVPPDEELRRVLPVVEALARQTSVPLSIDTYKAETAQAALKAGAHIVNDIFALRGDPAMADVVRQHRAGVILMHMQGTPQTMQLAPSYTDVVAEVRGFLEARLHAAATAGIEVGRVVIDPGIGFGKTVEHNLELLARLDELHTLARPVCLGVSRKRFLGEVLGRTVDDRLAGSLAVVCQALARGTADILRVHDVKETRDAVVMLAALADFRTRARKRGSEMGTG
jgi:dihydropteroate synthase